MTKYILIWKELEYINDTPDSKKGKIVKNTYTSLEKARAAAYRQVSQYSYIGRFAAISVKEVDGEKQKLVGDVVFDRDYAWGGSTGIFWIPPRCWHEEYRAQGVSSSGKLNDKIYRLT